MAEYVKVRPYVAKRLGVLDSRYRYADGSIRLWGPDMRDIDRGYNFRPDSVVAAIGGLRLNPYEAKQEQDSTAAQCRPLPQPESPEWQPYPDEIREGLATIYSDVAHDDTEDPDGDTDETETDASGNDGDSDDNENDNTENDTEEI